MRFVFALPFLTLMLLGQAQSNGIDSAAKPRSASPQNPIFNSADASKLGFKILKKKVKGEPNQMETSKFQVQKRWLTRIKSKYSSDLGRDSYYRFYIEEAVFPDSSLAQARLDSLYVEPPDLSPEDDKPFNLRSGFRNGNRVVVVGTDVVAYEEKMKQLTTALKLLDTSASVESKRRAVLLDSLGKALRVVRR